MSSFWKSLFGGKKDDGPRHLTHPRDLRMGDMLRIANTYALPKMLRDQAFRVVGVTTYQFEHRFETSLTLESERDDRITLMIEKEDGREQLVLSIDVTRAEVEQLFDLDQFAMVFDESQAKPLDSHPVPAFDGWTAPVYHRAAVAQRGYFYEADYRGSRPSDHEGEGEPFDYFLMTSEDGEYAVEIEVWEGGETDVSLTRYRPLDDVAELWPGSGAEAS